MNTQTDITYPDLAVEVLRYDIPEIYQFYLLSPSEVDHSKANRRPFQSRFYRGFEPGAQNYCEIERHQISAASAHQMRWFLQSESYLPVAFEDLPLDLAHFTTHNQCPIQFHQGLDGRDPEIMARVVVWVRGEMPRIP